MTANAHRSPALSRAQSKEVSATQQTHALSFDIEDWFHIVGVQDLENRERWTSFPSIVERCTSEILDLLGEFDLQATFFILGWVAEQYPSVVRMIADAGHEIGTHSFWHRKVYEMTPDDFFEDLVDSIDVLEQFEGVKVYGFRAPSFSITPGTEWAFDVIAKAGLDCPKVAMPVHRRFKCYVGRSSTARKLRRLLERYQFTTCRDVLRQHALLPAEKVAAEAPVEQDA